MKLIILEWLISLPWLKDLIFDREVEAFYDGYGRGFCHGKKSGRHEGIKEGCSLIAALKD